jgi:hypothetical protein
MTTTVPIRESVGAALRFVRENIRFIAIVAATGAAALTLVGAINLAAPGLALVTTIASTFLHAFVYAAFIGAAVFAPGDVRGRWLSDGLRVWAAMAIIGFFMLIVMFAASMVASIILVAGPLGPYLQELQAAGNDDTAVLAVMTRFAEQSPGTILTLMLFLGGIWILLTSRFYIAAPASVDQQRMLTFETWKWTRGAMLRITGARMMVLAPAYILLFAVAQLLGRLLGFDPLDPVSVAAFASGSGALYLLFVFISAFLSVGLYSALEAGLSSYLYRGLKPETPPVAT